MRTLWPHASGRPVIEVFLLSPDGTSQSSRRLLADTGAGSTLGMMELILSEADCRQFSAGDAGTHHLGGAFTGAFPAHWVNVTIPGCQFSDLCFVVGVPAAQLRPPLQGLACFRFLNRFTYGNFGDPNRFGLEVP